MGRVMYSSDHFGKIWKGISLSLKFAVAAITVYSFFDSLQGEIDLLGHLEEAVGLLQVQFLLEFSESNWGNFSGITHKSLKIGRIYSIKISAFNPFVGDEEVVCVEIGEANLIHNLFQDDVDGAWKILEIFLHSLEVEKKGFLEVGALWFHFFWENKFLEQFIQVIKAEKRMSMIRGRILTEALIAAAGDRARAALPAAELCDLLFVGTLWVHGGLSERFFSPDLLIYM